MLVGASQSRNNGRAVVFGSLEMLSNDVFALSNLSNAALTRDLGRIRTHIE